MSENSQKYRYSVVIPHYNSPALLQRMLNTIPQRNDIEVIVVDDGSKTENVELLKQLTHENLSLIFNSKNQGAGYSRNVGLDHAQGRWLLAVDADDLFADGAFDTLDRYADTDYDYIGYCIASVDDNLQRTNCNGKSDGSVRAFLNNPDKKSLKYFKFYNTEAWNKMVSLKFMRENNIRWEECRINVDVLFSFLLALNAKKFKVLPDEIYLLAGNNNSITRRKRTIEREFGFYLQAQKRNGFFKILGYGFPFYRYDWLYIPFLIKKRGIKDTIAFFKMRRRRWNEVLEARKKYVSLLDGIDIDDILTLPN